MRYRILQPPPAHAGPPATGGYRCNAELGARLARAGLGGIHAATDATLALELARARAADEVAIVDSLLLSTAPPEPAASGDRLLLLMHLPPSAEPGLAPELRAKLRAREAGWLRAARGVLTTSPQLACELAAVHQVRARSFQPGAEECFRVARAKQSNTITTLVAVGTLEPRKNQLALVQAAAALAAEGISLRLQLAGDATTHADYVAAIRAASSGIDLELTGRLEVAAVAARLQHADLFVSAALVESYGMAIAEAAACGLPIVAVRAGEAATWIQQDANGRLLESGDAESLRGALRSALAELPRWRAAARRDAPRLPDWDTSFAQFLLAAGVLLEQPGDDAGRPFAECRLPTHYGDFKVRVWNLADGGEAVVVQLGELAGDPPPFVRVHSECFTGEVLGSLKCDCRAQLDAALATIATRGRGAVVYLRQEGRGIGLGNKIRAYAAQELGADTIRANHLLGFPTDLRDFGVAARILLACGAQRIEVNTNNPDKIAALTAHGIAIAGVVPALTPPNPHNIEYLRTKLRELGHVGLDAVLGGGS